MRSLARVSSSPLSRRRLLGLAAAGLLGAGLLAAQPAAAQEDRATDAQALVDDATLTVQKLLRDEEFTDLAGYMRRAEAVLVFPQILKAGFILGAEGGRGVLLVRGDDGSWSPPAFYTLAAGSIGLQIGGQVSELVMTVMNPEALAALMENKVQLGGEISVAVGPVGKGAQASTTTNLNSDIIAFSKAVGLFGGGALEGAGLIPESEWNRAYYNAPEATAEAIVIERRYFNVGADALRQALRQDNAGAS